MDIYEYFCGNYTCEQLWNLYSNSPFSGLAKKDNQLNRIEEVDKFINNYCSNHCVLIFDKLGEYKKRSSSRYMGTLIYNENTILTHKLNRYQSIESYYKTVIHELAHSTFNILQRPIQNYKNGGIRRVKYLKEEIIAELSTYYICQKLNIDFPKEFAIGYIVMCYAKNNGIRHLGQYVRKVEDEIKACSNYILEGK